LERCLNRPLAYTDRGPWYPWALKLYGLRHGVEAFGRRNRVEAWFRALKARTRRFSNNFPHRSSLESEETWMASFTAIRNMKLGLS